MEKTITFEEYFEYRLYIAKVVGDTETVKSLENMIKDYTEFKQKLGGN